LQTQTPALHAQNGGRVKQEVCVSLHFVTC